MQLDECFCNPFSGKSEDDVPEENDGPEEGCEWCEAPDEPWEPAFPTGVMGTYARIVFGIFDVFAKAWYKTPGALN